MVSFECFGRSNSIKARHKGSPDSLSGLPLRFRKEGPFCFVAIHIRVADIPWESVRMLNIDGHRLQVVTDIGSFDFQFQNSEKLSEALLILALQSTKQVEFLDDRRFNPARFL